MISFTTPALVLRENDVGEADRIYSILTRERGKIDVFAKSIRRADSKLQSSMGPLMLLEVYIIAQRRFTLGGTVILQPYKHIRESLERMWAAQHVLDVVGRMTKQEFPDQKLFDLVAQAFAILDIPQPISHERLVYLVAAFDIRLLEILGHKPSLISKDMDDEYVRLSSDGLHKPGEKHTHSSITISPETRSLLRFAQEKDLQDAIRVSLSLSQAQAVWKAVTVLYTEHDIIPFQSAKMLVRM